MFVEQFQQIKMSTIYRCCAFERSKGAKQNCLTPKTQSVRFFRSFEAFVTHMRRVHRIKVFAGLAPMKTLVKTKRAPPGKYSYFWDDGTPCTKEEYDASLDNEGVAYYWDDGTPCTKDDYELYMASIEEEEEDNVNEEDVEQDDCGDEENDDADEEIENVDEAVVEEEEAEEAIIVEGSVEEAEEAEEVNIEGDNILYIFQQYQ